MGYPLDLDEYNEDRLQGELDRRARMRAEGRCDYCGYPAGQSIRQVITARIKAKMPGYTDRTVDSIPPGVGDTCRFPDRHGRLA